LSNKNLHFEFIKILTSPKISRYVEQVLGFVVFILY
jgi:hypothetical protein